MRTIKFRGNMKTNEAPEKIYIFENPILDFTKLSVRQSDTDIEYTRTDAFIDKACKYIKKNVCEHISHKPLYKDYRHEEEMGFQLVVDEQFYIDFKNAMKGE